MVLKAIVDGQSYVDIKNKIESQEWPDRWNIVIGAFKFYLNSIYVMNAKCRSVAILMITQADVM